MSPSGNSGQRRFELRIIRTSLFQIAALGLTIAVCGAQGLPPGPGTMPQLRRGADGQIEVVPPKQQNAPAPASGTTPQLRRGADGQIEIVPPKQQNVPTPGPAVAPAAVPGRSRDPAAGAACDRASRWCDHAFAVRSALARLAEPGERRRTAHHLRFVQASRCWAGRNYLDRLGRQRQRQQGRGNEDRHAVRAPHRRDAGRSVRQRKCHRRQQCRQDRARRRGPASHGVEVRRQGCDTSRLVSTRDHGCRRRRHLGDRTCEGRGHDRGAL